MDNNQEDVVNQEEPVVNEECEKAKTSKEDTTCDQEKEKKEEKKEAKEHRFGRKKKVDDLEEEIIKLKEELANSKNAYFKVYADTENLKKRLQSEAENTRKYRIQSFAAELLPILDSFERALGVKLDDENITNYVKGFEMIHTQLVNILTKEGVTEIEALNKPFDPNIHQALMQETKEGVESGVVIEVLQKGYMLKDRVLRATLVKVSE